MKIRMGKFFLPFLAAGMLELERVVPLKPYRGFAPRG